MAVPMEGQQNRWKDKDAFGKEEYDELYKQMDRIVILSGKSSGGSDYEERNEASRRMNRRNKWMLDHSSSLIAVYNDSKKNGGTANTFRDAQHRKKSNPKFKITRIDPRVGANG